MDVRLARVAWYKEGYSVDSRCQRKWEMDRDGKSSWRYVASEVVAELDSFVSLAGEDALLEEEEETE